MFPHPHRRDRSRRSPGRSARLNVELLEPRLVMSDISIVPVWDGERHDPSGDLLNYFGGNPVMGAHATVEHTTEVVHDGGGAFLIKTNQPIAANSFDFVAAALTGFGPSSAYVDTRDITGFETARFWLRNDTSSPFQLVFEIKDYRDSNASRARWAQVIPAASLWTEVSIPLDVSAANGWTVIGAPDLTRTRLFAFVIQANQGAAVNGSIYLDDLDLVERGGPLDAQTAPVDDILARLTQRQFRELWGTRDRTTGLVPSISAYADVVALNTTAGVIKMLPGVVQRGWGVNAAQADAYVAQVVGTLNQVMDQVQATGNGGYLPPRYLDRVTLKPTNLQEESPVDAAYLFLALYQYRSLARVKDPLRTAIQSFLDRFNWTPFASPGGWKLAYDYGAKAFTPGAYDSYSGEIWTISLAAHLSQAHHVAITALYNSGVHRVLDHLIDPAHAHLVSTDPGLRPPFTQWVFSLWVDVSARGTDTFPDPALAGNPYANALLYQQEVDDKLAALGRPLFVQPDAGDDGTGANYQQFSLYDDHGKPSLFMPWSNSFAFLAEPAVAEDALRNTLQHQLAGPLGLADSALWNTGEPEPASVAARTDFWNLTLSTWALLQYQYDDNALLTGLPAVRHALDLVFKGLIVTPSGAATDVAEGGGLDTYTVQLTSQPADDVTVTLSTDGQVQVAPPTLTFTPDDWNVPQTVTVGAADDVLVEGTHTGTIHQTTASADEGYDNLPVADVLVGITDNDSARSERDILLAAANRYARSANAADLGHAIVPLYTDYFAGGTYGAVDDSARVTLDGNDPIAAVGASSFRMSWDGSGPSGYFQFGIGPGVANRPRAAADFGMARTVRFLAAGDTAGRQLEVNVYQTVAGGGFQLVASQWFTLATSFADYALDLPAGLRPEDLFSVQWLLDTEHDGAGGTVRLDEVRIDTDDHDHLRVIQSYPAPLWAPTGSALSTPAGRDNVVYPNRSFLYDNALAIKSLIAAGDAVALQTARDLADAILATAANGLAGYFNVRNSGHVLLGDGSVRDPYSKLQTLGDNSWLGMALLDLNRVTGDARYLTRAREISDWAEANLRAADGFKGYRGGFDETGQPLPWRATEHNVDYFQLNRLLADTLAAAGDPAAATYAARATYAGDFVIAMFDSADGKFRTGTTGANPDQINQASVPLDVQLWPILTLAQAPAYAAAVDWSRPRAWAQAHLVQSDGALTGFTFSDHATPNRVWLEGVAQGVAVDRLLGDNASVVLGLKTLGQAAIGGAGLPAASSDALADPLLGTVYDARLAIAPTAWTAMDRAGRNPFDLLHLMADRFDRPDSNSLGPLWTRPAGSWSVQSNHLMAPAGPMSIAVAPQASAADVSVQAEVALAATGGAQVGLVARYRGAGDSNLYAGMLVGTSAKATARIYRNVGGTWTLLASAPAGSGTGTLRFDVFGDVLRLFKDGVLLASAVDNQIKAPGLAGVRGTAATVDNFACSALPPLQSFGDDFNRADSADLGDNYAQRQGHLSLQGNRLIAPAGMNLAVYTGAFAADVSVAAEVTLAAGGTSAAGLVARYTGNTSLYLATLGGTFASATARIYRIAGGMQTLLASAPAGQGTGLLRFDVLGNALKLYKNDVLLASTIDGQVKGPGLAGVRANLASLDNFGVQRIFSTLTFADDFDRPDSTNLGSVYAERVGNFAIKSHQVSGVSGVNLAVYTGAFAADVSVQANVTLPPVGGGALAGLIARAGGTGDSNYYQGALVRVGGAFVARIARNVGGVTTVLASAAAPVGVGTLRFDVVGHSLRLFLNDVLLASATDSTIQAAGFMGLRGSGAAYDNFVGEVLGN